MGWQIVKQPDGKYAIWSTGCDAFVATDGTAEEIAGEFARVAAEEARTRARERIAVLDAGGRPYLQFTLSYEECLERIAEREKPSEWEEMQS